MSVLSMLKKEIYESGIKGKLGALLLKKAFENLKEKMDYTKVGGSPFLGVEKIVVKSHGSSKAKTIHAAIAQVKTIHEAKIIDKIKEYSAQVLAAAEGE